VDPQSAQFFGLGMAVAALLSAAIYCRMGYRIWRWGGRVRPEYFGLGDLLASLVLIGFFAMLAGQHYLQAGDRKPAAMTVEQVLPSSVLLVLIAVALAGFLRMRKVPVREHFGLRGHLVPRAAGWAALLLPAALPMLLVVASLTQVWLQSEAVEQEMVKLFRDVIRRGDQGAAMQIAFAGAVLAPITEEFIFRGYFYGVFKRYAGALTSAAVTAALFAASHANLASLPALFVLALCFTVAYEATGSLLVPIGMHALFNSASLSLLYWQATQAPAT
jgi:membrane protease YdiL (CAAX protease family)